MLKLKQKIGKVELFLLLGREVSRNNDQRKNIQNVMGKNIDKLVISNTDPSIQRIIYHPQQKTIELEVTNLSNPNQLLNYISEYENLEKLTITLTDQDNLSTTGINLPIEKLEIIANFQSSWCDTIGQILMCTYNLKEFTLHEGNLSVQTITKLQSPKIDTIKLINTRILPQHKEALLTIITQSKNLKNLELTATNSRKYNVVFEEVVNEFLKIYQTPNNLIEKLKFTLHLLGEQNLQNISQLTNLKELTVNFSSHQTRDNFTTLFDILNKMPKIKLKFEEYHKEFNSPYSPLYLADLKARSKRYKKIILDLFPESEIILLDQN